MSDKHTATPWNGDLMVNGRGLSFEIANESGKRIATVGTHYLVGTIDPMFLITDHAEIRANKDFVVRTVNNHDALVAALLAQEAFDNHCMDCEDCQYGPLCEAGVGLSVKAQAMRKDAIAKLNGGKQNG